MSHKYKQEELVNFAKSQLISSIFSIATPANIRGLWVYDQTGATSTITDRSGNGLTATLRDGSLNAINASTLSPAVSGLSPVLTFDTTHLFDVADADNLSFVGVAMSFMALIKPTLSATSYFAKHDETTGSTNMEYLLSIGDNGRYSAYLYDDNTAAYKYRSGAVSPALISNTFGTVAHTDDGSNAHANIHVYVNGANSDGTSGSSGTYTAMENKGARFGSYYKSAAGAVSGHFLGGIGAIVMADEEWTAEQIRLLDIVMRSYAGVFV